MYIITVSLLIKFKVSHQNVKVMYYIKNIIVAITDKSVIIILKRYL